MMAIGLLTICAYLIGSIPTAHWVGRRFLGIDLAKKGSGYSGVSNLWKLSSWRIWLPVSLFDISKGIWMVLAAKIIGLGIEEQIVVGIAAIIGHNWPVFLRFRGGRGNSVSLGVGLIIPTVNGFLPVPILVCLAIVTIALLIFHDSSIGTFIGFITLPMTSYLMGDPLPMILGFLTMLFLILLARLTAPFTCLSSSRNLAQLLLNRIIFDRDVRKKTSWANKIHSKVSSPK